MQEFMETNKTSNSERKGYEAFIWEKDPKSLLLMGQTKNA